MRPQKTSPFSWTALLLLLTLLATAASGAQVQNEDIGSIQYNSNISAYEIKTVQNLQDLSYYVRGILTSGVPANDAKGKTFKMTTDINTTFSSGCASILPIGTSTYPFKGVFDGQGHTLGYICIDRSSENNVGLFGYIYEATVKNLRLYGAKVNGKDTVGGIVAYNYGNVSNCSLDSSIVTGKNRVGGITGYSGITLKNNTVNNLVRITGTDEVGCIVGRGNNVVRDNFCNGALFYNTDAKKAGAISKVTTGQFQNNYYYNVRVGSTKKNSGFGTYSGDAPINNAALPVAKITRNSSNLIIMTDSAVADKNNTPYWIPDSSIEIKSKESMSSGQRADFIIKTSSNKTVSVSYDTSRTTTYGHFTMPAEDVTISLGTPKDVYGKVIYHNLEGAENSSNNPSRYKMYQSGNINLENATKTGYTFSGWWKNASFSGTYYTYLTTTDYIYSRIELYAKWTANTYSVKFSSNGGSGSMRNQAFTYDDAPKALSANTFTAPAGFGEFMEWNTQANGSGTAYQDAQEVANLTSESNGIVTLYAQWKKNIATNGDILVSKIPDQEWTGDPIEPAITVMDGETDISKEMDIAYSDNTSVGEATVTITAKATSTIYSGSTTTTFNIVKATPTVTAPVANELYYNGKAQALVTAGSTNFGTLLYSLNGRDFSEEIPTATAPDNYTVYYKVNEGENYNGTEGSIYVRIEGTYTYDAFMEIIEANGKKYVTLDGNYAGDEPFELEEDIEVEEVKLNRTFPTTGGTNFSTITLPFEVNTSQLSGVSSIFEFSQVGKNKETGVLQVEVTPVWKKEGSEHAKLSANKPYLIQVEEGQLTISGAVTFKKAEEPIVTKNDWTFVGTYAYKYWGEHDSELGRIYGFSATPLETSSGKKYDAGQFFKVAAGSFIKPMRAYLYYRGKPMYAPSANGSASPTASIVEGLPDMMDVVIVERDDEEEEHTTVIGKFNTRTGEFRLNRGTRTFDLKGRNVGKQKAKGVYLKK